MSFRPSRRSLSPELAAEFRAVVWARANVRGAGNEAYAYMEARAAINPADPASIAHARGRKAALLAALAGATPISTGDCTPSALSGVRSETKASGAATGPIPLGAASITVLPRAASSRRRAADRPTFTDAERDERRARGHLRPVASGNVTVLPRRCPVDPWGGAAA